MHGSRKASELPEKLMAFSRDLLPQWLHAGMKCSTLRALRAGREIKTSTCFNKVSTPRKPP
eukprot:6468850-Amphidinium_carterae.1